MNAARGEEPPPPAHDVGRDSAADRFLRPLLSDSTLWPILIVVMAVLATFFGSVLLVALRRRSLAAAAALLGLAWLTTGPLADSWRRRRLGPAAGLAVVLWLLAVAVALLGARTGLL